METVRPVYVKLLIGALILFVAGVCVALSDIYYKVGSLEHDMMHVTGKAPAICAHK